jgi:hypothetical protein
MLRTVYCDCASPADESTDYPSTRSRAERSLHWQRPHDHRSNSRQHTNYTCSRNDQHTMPIITICHLSRVGNSHTVLLSTHRRCQQSIPGRRQHPAGTASAMLPTSVYPQSMGIRTAASCPPAAQSSRCVLRPPRNQQSTSSASKHTASRK